jgi:hypothetical protein
MSIYRGDGGSVSGLTESEVILIAISQGGTGSSTASGARTNLGLGTAATTDASAYATAAQGALADSATQPGDLATVATSGDYDDLSNKPTLGTAAAEDVGYFATAAQGTLADSAVQPGDLATVATTGSYNDLTDLPTAGSGTVTSVALSVPTGLSVSGSPVTTSGTLAVTLTSGYSIPTTAKQTEWDTAYGWGNHASAGYLTSETYTGTVTSVAATVPTGFTVSGSPITSSGTLALGFDTGYSLPTTAKQTNWDTAYGWGNHASAGYLTSETYTGTVTSVALTVPTGLSVSGSPVTSSGTLAVTLTSGYSIPTTSSQTNWDTAYSWGNHASAGYLTSYTETDPVYVASSWYSTTNNSGNWNTAYGWGNHASAGYLTSSSTLDASKLSGTIDGGTY